MVNLAVGFHCFLCFLLVFVVLHWFLLGLRGLTIPANGQSCCWFSLFFVFFINVCCFTLVFVGFAGG